MAMNATQRPRLSASPRRYYADLDDTLPSARSGIVRLRRSRAKGSSWLDDPVTARWVVAGIWVVAVGLFALLATLVMLGRHGA